MPFGGIIQARTPTLMAGRLRHKIDIVKIVPTQDENGAQTVNSNTVYANVWATVQALSGTEKFAAHEFVSQVTHQVIIRYIGAAPSWQAGWTYAVGDLVKDSNGNLQQCTVAGTSAAIAPTWATALSATTTETTGVTWKNLGAAPYKTGITADMQIWFGTRQFQIESVLNPDERNKMLILMCLEINDSTQQAATPGGLT